MAGICHKGSAATPADSVDDATYKFILQVGPAPHCVRERGGATVSMPVTWKKVAKGFDPGDFPPPMPALGSSASGLL